MTSKTGKSSVSLTARGFPLRLSTIGAHSLQPSKKGSKSIEESPFNQAVRARAEEMLPLPSQLPQQQHHAVSSKDTSARSPQIVESEDSATERESDAEEEAYVSENDLEITG